MFLSEQRPVYLYGEAQFTSYFQVKKTSCKAEDVVTKALWDIDLDKYMSLASAQYSVN